MQQTNAIVEELFLRLFIRDINMYRHYSETLPKIAFTNADTRRIFEILKSLQGKITGLPTFDSFVIALGEENETNPTEYDGEVIEKTFSLFEEEKDINHEYVEQTFIKNVKKRLLRIVGTTLSDGSTSGVDAKTFIQDIEHLELRESEPSSYLDRVEKWAKMLVDDGKNRIPTGIPTLDRELNGGMLPGEYTVVIGYTNSGKSFIGSNIAINAIRFGFKVVHFTNENPIHVVMGRYASGLLEMPIHKIQTKALHNYPNDEPYQAITKFTQEETKKRFPKFEMGDYLHIFDLRDTQSTVSAMENHIDRLEKFQKFKPNLVILDDLDNMEGKSVKPKGNNQNEEKDLTDASKALNELADNRGLVLWVMAQMKGTEGFKEDVDFGKGESRSKRAKAEIPDNSFYNLQTKIEKEPEDRDQPIRSRLSHKRARNLKRIERQINLIHKYEICRIYDADIFLQEDKITRDLF